MFNNIKIFLSNMNLRNRLIFLFVFTASFPILLASIFSINYFNSTNLNNSKDNLRDKLHTAELLYQKKRNDIEKITQLASTDNMIIVNLELLLYQPITNYFKVLIKSNNISFLSILDNNGKLIISGNKNYFLSPEKPIFDSKILLIAQSKGYSTNYLKLISKEFNSIERQNVDIDSTAHIICSISPIYSYDKKLLGYILGGYILGEKNNKSLLEEIKKNVNSDILLLYEDKILAYSPVTRKNKEPKKISYDKKQLIEYNKRKSLTFLNFEINNNNYLYSFAPIYDNQIISPISLGIGIPESHYLSVRDRTAVIFLFITILALIMAALIAYFISQNISIPILSILEGTKHIVKGNFKKKIKIDSEDEIGLLAKSFNLMTKQLSRRIELDNLVSELSRKFINLTVSNTDNAINYALEKISLFVKVDRSYIFLFSKDGKTISNIFEWCKKNIYPLKKESQNVPISQYPWFMNLIKKHDYVYIPETRNLPEKANLEKKRWLELNIKSIICVPMFYDETLKGFIGFEFLRGNNFSTKEDVQLLRIIGEIICNSLERKKYQDKLTNTKNYLNHVFNAQSSILISIDNNFKITQWNKSAEKFSKIKAKKAKSNIIWNVMPFLQKYENILKSTLKNKKPVTLRHEILSEKKFNITNYFDISFFPLNFEDINGVVIRIEDKTELVKKDEQLLQAQKMETVGNLAGGLAHDFNNVIGAISGTVSFIKHFFNSKNFNEDDFIRNINIIEKSTKRAGDMVSQLLTLSRKHELLFTPVDMNFIISNVVKIGEHLFDKRIKIITEYLQSKATIYADAGQIEQIALNLCINACHAMTIMRSDPENEKNYGGTLTLTIDKIRNIKKYNEVHPEAVEGDYILLKVSDNGVGMDNETLSKIFDPFFTTKAKEVGTGLGLAMVYNIIKQHNGFINVYSEKNIGTTFTVFLPYFKNDNIESNDQLNLLEPIKGSGTILVIDDEELIRQMIQNILVQCGYNILLSDNGKKGLELYKKNITDIDLVLLDMAMPVLSGDKVYKKIKELNPEAKILLSSGFKQDRRVQKIIDSGVDGFIQKPYSMLDLTKIIHKILNSK